ncbi:COQ9 family protein [Alphaproteobacteria bacterium]|nr:COQ9 family protein [Alphaproteobacteria bacterium]MDC3270129.1 COQ9 family protein [Alphaproteobacteria bacterium]
MKIQNNYLQKKRLEVLNFAKASVSEKGLNQNSLEKISKKYDLDINEIELLFPEGNIDLIKLALERLNIEVEEYCRKIDLIRLPIHKRIRQILLSKISLMNKNKIFYRSIFLNLLIPKKNFSLSGQLYKSVDQIWFIAGDSSTDFNFYTKRLILSAIYSRIILYFFNNNNQQDLENILDESLKRVAKIPEIKSKLKIFKEYFPKVAKFVKNSY